jgi:DNA-binding response OmpR family regulator
MADKRLLVVDDDIEFGEFVRKVGLELGYAVDVQSDARTFQQAYKAFDPDTIVLDIVMPEVDGVEVVRWLADQGSRAKVILITGYTAHYAEVARTLGEVGGLSSMTTLTKPVRLAELRAAIAG